MLRHTRNLKAFYSSNLEREKKASRTSNLGEGLINHVKKVNRYYRYMRGTDMLEAGVIDHRVLPSRAFRAGFGSPCTNAVALPVASGFFCRVASSCCVVPSRRSLCQRLSYALALKLPLVLKSKFFGPTTARLQSLILHHIPFPALPKLFLSTTDLVCHSPAPPAPGPSFWFHFTQRESYRPLHVEETRLALA